MRAANVGINRLELIEEDFVSAALGELPPGAVRIDFEMGLPQGATTTGKRFQARAWHKRTDSNDEVAIWTTYFSGCRRAVSISFQK